MNHRIMFLRDRKDQPVGCVAIKVIKSDKPLVVYGVSTLNPQDNFNRAVARQLALGRIIETPNSFLTRNNPSMHNITEGVMLDIAVNYKLPNRARQAAKLWLKKNSDIRPY
jgi:hypothetical protein